MGKGNKIGIAISALSVLVIGGSVYYYNANVSKSSERVQQTTITTITTSASTTEMGIVLNKENVKISTEIKDQKTAVVTLENISERNLTDVIVEGNYRDSKIAGVVIPTLTKGEIKKLEFPLDNKLNSPSIKEDSELIGNFRMIEKSEFSFEGSKGEILVSSLKAQEKSFYIEKIKESSLEQSLKDDLIKKVEAAGNVEEIEKLLKENKIIEELQLGSDYIVFKEGEKELKIESTAVSDSTTTVVSTQSTTTTNSSSSVTTATVGTIATTRQAIAQTTQAAPIYGYIPAQQTPRIVTTQAPVRTTVVVTTVAPVTSAVSAPVATETVTTGQ